MTDEIKIRQKPGRKPTGRPENLIPDEKTENDIEQLSARGLTQDQMADYFGVHLSTFEQSLRRNDNLRDAFRRGKSKQIALVSGELIKQIKEGSTAATIFFLKTQAKWKETSADQKHVIVTKNEEEKVKFKDKDPIEAAKLYQEIMLGSQLNERNSNSDE